MSLELARQVLTTEAEAILRPRDHLDENFVRAVDLLASVTGRVVLTGMGKSRLVCRKRGATMASTGTPALFLHPAEAIHGDLGIVTDGGAVVALSNSGETDEIPRLMVLQRQGIPAVAMTSNPRSSLASQAAIHLNLGVDRALGYASRLVHRLEERVRDETRADGGGAVGRGSAAHGLWEGVREAGD